MEGIIPLVGPLAKPRLHENLNRLDDARTRIRYLIVINLLDQRSPTEIARVLKVARSTVYRVAARFSAAGEAGLVDRREDNGDRKVDEDYLAALDEVVASSPLDHGWPRPTWTREMLIMTLRRKTGIRIARSTMSQALRTIEARLGRPKPTVACPWPEAEKQQHLQEIRELVDHLPPDEVAVYEDEVDIHLNPKIGRDWMVRGQQKQVPTPGKNEKRYLAGAKDARTGELIYVEGEHKSSPLFILLLWELVRRHREAKVIHVILDNYSIHSTRQVQLSLDTPEGRRLKLHFLPPYCPDHNKIERTWQDLHANVTRNHRCADMKRLMSNVRKYLRRFSRSTARAAA